MNNRRFLSLAEPTVRAFVGALLSAFAVAMPLAAEDLVSDPSFPLVRVPAEYDSHRTTKRFNPKPGEGEAILDVTGPGCVRHFWITTETPERLHLDVTCDGAKQSQISMPLNYFFGILLNQKPYRIESAPIKLLPKSGLNSYFPIPFQESCRIVLRNTSKHETAVWSMVNWQKFGDDVTLSPLRLFAHYSEQNRAEPLGTTLLGSIEGKGFVAGMIHAIRRHDKRDMIWHTGGDTWLIDGETNPHVLRGIGSEDVFGHSFGVWRDASQWSGGVHLVGEGKDTSEVVAYRFFGPDSIAFKSSLVLRFGARANDYESVLYFYKDLTAVLVEVETPREWTLSGPFQVSDYEAFKKDALPRDVAEGTAKTWNWGRRKLAPVKITPEHTWIDFTRWYRANGHGNTGTQPHECAAYATTVIPAERPRKAVLRLGFDDWAKIWLNGQPVTTLRHDDGLKTAELPVTLKQGDNQLIVRLSNFDNVQWRCWAFSCVVRDVE